MTSLSRSSVYVHPAPTRTSLDETSIPRNSGRFQMLTSLRAASVPAAYCTITSVPPAIGCHPPRASASNASTAPRLPGATNSYSTGAALMMQLRVSPLLPPPQRSVHSPYNGTGFLPNLPGSLAALAAPSFAATATPPESSPEYRSHTALLRTPETSPAVRATAAPAPILLP